MKLSKKDLQYLANGATFLGGGGGGTRRAGMKMIEKNFGANDSVELVTVDEIPDGDHDLTVACGFLAAQNAVEDSTDIEDLGIVLEAFRKLALDEGLGRIARLVPIELGVQSCVIPICLTAHALNSSKNGWDLKVLDADGAGRAVPIISATTLACASHDNKTSLFPALFGGMIPEINGVPAGAFCLRFQGEDCTAYHLQTTASGAISGYVDGAAALACWPMQSKVQVEAAFPLSVRGTLSMSRELGRILSVTNGDPLQAAMQFLGKHKLKTYNLFQGTIESVSDDQRRVVLTNGKESMTVLNDGENLVSILGGRVNAMAPDSICFVTEDGVAFSSAEANELQNKGKYVSVHVVGIPAREEIRNSVMASEAFKYYRTETMSHERQRTESKMAAVGGFIDVSEFKAIEDLNPAGTVATAK